MKDLEIVYTAVNDIKLSEYNPRRWNKTQIENLKESIRRFGLCDPLICNIFHERKNVLIGGHFRLQVAKELGIKEVPVIYLNISDLEKEKELNLRLNKNLGEFDYDLLKDFNESFLTDIGFTSEELDEIFAIDPIPEMFDLKKELEKLNIHDVKVQKGDIYEIDGSKWPGPQILNTLSTIKN